MKYIEVVNLERFQHYKTRRPPWIKLYRSILDDPDWEGLTDTTFRVGIVLLMLASEFDNRIPYNLPWIKKRGGIAARKRSISGRIADLERIGFVAVVEEIEESCKQSAPLEREREGTTTVPIGTSVVPAVPPKKLTSQQQFVDDFWKLCEARGLGHPSGKWVAGWRKRWSDDEALTRCASEILDSAELPPGDPWSYFAKLLTSALKNGKRVWKGGRRGAAGAGAAALQGALELEDDEPYDVG